MSLGWFIYTWARMNFFRQFTSPACWKALLIIYSLVWLVGLFTLIERNVYSGFVGKKCVFVSKCIVFPGKVKCSKTFFRLNSRIGITFSRSDGLNGIRTQAKLFLGPRVLFPHPPSYAACVLMGTAIFYHSIFSWLLNTTLNRIDSFTN